MRSVSSQPVAWCLVSGNKLDLYVTEWGYKALRLCHIWHSMLMSINDTPLVWLHGEVKSPPLSVGARIEAGYWLRELQSGKLIALPHSRPMPTIGTRCHELRITDENRLWRIVYRIDHDAIIIADVFEKKATRTPKAVIANCRKRLSKYDHESD